MIREAEILIVDDEPNNLKILQALLSQAGYTIFAANSGERALLQVNYHQPDMILLDVMMPGIDGVETCRRLKANAATAHIPVIFLTALAETSDKVKGFKAGGVDYITKPFEHEEALVRIETHLTIVRLQKEVEAQNHDLRAALAEVKRLSGLLSICSNCKKIRDEDNRWAEIEVYIHQHSEASFSHGICPDCLHELYPDFVQRQRSENKDIIDVLTRLEAVNLADVVAATGQSEESILAGLQTLSGMYEISSFTKGEKIYYQLVQR